MIYQGENSAESRLMRQADASTLTNEAVAALLPVLTRSENPLAELLSVVLNAAMRLERQEHLRAEPHERTLERNGRARAISLGAIASGFKERRMTTR